MPVTDADIGPCQVCFGAAGAEVTLGNTFGGVKLRIAETVTPAKIDQAGESPINQIITGLNANVDCFLADLSLDNWAAVMPGATLEVIDTHRAVTIHSPVGTDEKSLAKRLILKRIVNGEPSTNKEDWITFYEAAPQIDGELTFDATTQRAIPLKFTCYRDTDGFLGFFGDEDAIAV